MTSLGGGAAFEGGRRRSRGLKAKTLRRMLKKKGLKTTGKKSTLMKRLHMRGGVELMPGAEGVNEQGKAAVDEALAPSEDDFASPPPVKEQGGKRRRRRSRRRREEEGGRRKSRREEKKKAAEGLPF